MILISSGSTGGGGGGGDVNGPASSVQYSVPVFGGTDGKTLIDSAVALTMVVPPGNTVVYDPNDPTMAIGIKFAGTGAEGPIADRTGFRVETYSASNLTSLYPTVDSWAPMRWEFGNPDATSNGPTWKGFAVVTTVLSVLRPDTGIPVDIGRGGNSFVNIYSDKIIVGGGVNGHSPQSTRRVMFTSAYAGSPAGGTYGMGLNDAAGNEWYVNLTSNAGVNYRDAFSVVLSTNTLSILSAPANAVNDSSAAITIHAKGADKTNGTGDGGDLLLSGGSSVAGLAGAVKVTSRLGLPIDRVDITSGTSHTVADDANYCVLNGAGGTIATFAVTLPANPVDGQQLTITTDSTITAFSVSPTTGHTSYGGIATIFPGSPFCLVFVEADAHWYATQNE